MKNIKVLCFMVICLLTFSGNIYAGYIVVGTNVNMRTSPDVNSKIVKVMDIGSFVSLIKKGPKAKIGNLEGEWWFVSTELYNEKTNKPDTGWIFSYYLSSKNVEKVKKIKLEPNSFIIECRFPDEDNIMFKFIVYEDGTFKVFMNEEENGSGIILKDKSYYFSKTKKWSMAAYFSFYIDEKNKQLILIKDFHHYDINPKKFKLLELPVTEPYSYENDK